jgi:hypothetical protein
MMHDTPKTIGHRYIAPARYKPTRVDMATVGKPKWKRRGRIDASTRPILCVSPNGHVALSVLLSFSLVDCTACAFAEACRVVCLFNTNFLFGIYWAIKLQSTHYYLLSFFFFLSALESAIWYLLE